ncbi:MAG: hypothetical protein ACXADD_15025 [Candidatus Thorarchaeota archaeon]
MNARPALSSEIFLNISSDMSVSFLASNPHSLILDSFSRIENESVGEVGLIDSLGPNVFILPSEVCVSLVLRNESKLDSAHLFTILLSSILRREEIRDGSLSFLYSLILF